MPTESRWFIILQVNNVHDNKNIAHLHRNCNCFVMFSRAGFINCFTNCYRKLCNVTLNQYHDDTCVIIEHIHLTIYGY